MQLSTQILDLSHSIPFLLRNQTAGKMKTSTVKLFQFASKVMTFGFHSGNANKTESAIGPHVLLMTT